MACMIATFSILILFIFTILILIFPYIIRYSHFSLFSLQVPVGPGTLGRILNVIGEPVDEQGDEKEREELCATHHEHKPQIFALHLNIPYSFPLLVFPA